MTLTAMKRAQKIRLDQLLVDRGLAESREKAQALILAGEVRVDGQKSDKPGHSIPDQARIELLERMPYVSRGGFKLAGALDHFAIDVTGRVCLDVGASTGGFTDCLLQRGAARVCAVDVGHGQIDWKLRHDPRVDSSRRRERALSSRGGFSTSIRPRGLRRELHLRHAVDSCHRAVACGATEK